MTNFDAAPKGGRRYSGRKEKQAEGTGRDEERRREERGRKRGREGGKEGGNKGGEREREVRKEGIKEEREKAEGGRRGRRKEEKDRGGEVRGGEKEVFLHYPQRFPLFHPSRSCAALPYSNAHLRSFAQNLALNQNLMSEEAHGSLDAAAAGGGAAFERRCPGTLALGG